MRVIYTRPNNNIDKYFNQNSNAVVLSVNRMLHPDVVIASPELGQVAQFSFPSKITLHVKCDCY